MNLQTGVTIDMGQNPLQTGSYLFMLTLQIGWKDNAAGPLTDNGFAQVVDGTNPIYTMPWGLFKTSTSPDGSGTAASYTFFFQATMTNLNEIWIKSQGAICLLGASLVVFPVPTNVITSPGFI